MTSVPQASPGRDSLPAVAHADVYKAGRLAATLERLAAGVRFTYRPDYLADNGPAVATTLPLTAESRLTPAGAVPAFFAGLLPEGRRLSAIRRAVKTSADDDLSLLLAVGADTVGDVQVFPGTAAPHHPAPALEVADFTDVRFTDLFARSTGEDPDRVGIPGVQDKVSARMTNLPNEAFFIQAARLSGLETVDAHLVRDAVGAAGLLVRRFDRTVRADGSITTHAVEDACQVLDRYPANKYALTSEHVTAAGPQRDNRRGPDRGSHTAAAARLRLPDRQRGRTR